MNLIPAPIQAISVWSLDDVRNALDMLEMGDYSQASLLCDAMGRDDRIHPCLRTRTSALTARTGGLPFSVEPSDSKDQRRARGVAATVEDEWWQVVPEDNLAQVLSWRIMLGTAVGQITKIKNDEGVWQDRLEPLPPHNLRWEEYSKRWMYRLLDGEVEVTPGKGGWFLDTPGGTHMPWMGGAVRALGVPWAFKGFTDRDWARFCERHGMPIIAIQEPDVIKPEAKSKFYSAIRSMGANGFLRLPTNKDGVGYKASFLEPMGSAWATFEAFLSRLDRAITIVLLGQDGTTQQSSSSGYAQAKVMERVANQYLASDAASLSTVLREQVWKPWGRFYIPNWKDALAPYPTWQCEQAEDLQATANMFVAVADGLTKLVGLQVPVDVEAVAEKFGIPLRDGARVPEVEAPEPKVEATPTMPPVPVVDEGDDQPPPTVDPTELSTVALAARGAVDGQAYVDELADTSRDRARIAMAPDVAAIRAIIAGAKDYDDISDRIVAAYSKMSASRLATLVQKAIVLSDLAGRTAVLEDL